jgi:hypothetical protein
MNEIALTRLLKNLLRISGREIKNFELKLLDGKSVRVLLDGVVAHYPLEGWTSRLLRHLYAGFFDPRRAACAIGYA